MKLSIQPLTIHNQNDFFSLFDDDTFSHQMDWKKCYCISYHTTCSAQEWNQRTDKDNLEEAIRLIREGGLHGLLAYDEDQCIAWLNVNDARSYSRVQDELDKRFLDGKTAMATCFIIKPTHRGQHVASGLLEYAVDYCKELGYKTLISIQYVNPSHVHNFSGPPKMYLDRGFQEYIDASETAYVVKDISN
ncbi:MAG: GNAT family N-acetyltransferase [Bacilli bacterium]|nr:GNAT family N-acetyltransferase [Bacilli bacterium]MBN2876172.1 GNAT family N-acetyltransferase [Bacilli bacterium]